MAPKCNLIIDSCCDMPRSLWERDGVTLLNFNYTLDGQEHMDDAFASLDPHEFYETMRNGADCKTTQLTIPVMAEALTAAAETGVPTVFFCFSSQLSGTFDSSLIALDMVKEQYPDAELYVVDSKAASTAELLFVDEALKQREKGLTAQEMVAWGEEARYHVNAIFTLDSLTWLAKGGRIPAAAAKIGGKLDVKPMLDLAPDGSLGLAGMARNRKKSMKAMVDKFTKLIPEENRPGRVLAIGHADCPEDFETLKSLLRKTCKDIEFIESNIGPVIGSHVGPGMMSLVFWGPDRRK